jgi:hypothetical protein
MSRRGAEMVKVIMVLRWDPTEEDADETLDDLSDVLKDVMTAFNEDYVKIESLKLERART